MAITQSSTSLTASPSIPSMYPLRALSIMPLYTAIPRMIPMKRQAIRMLVREP